MGGLEQDLVREGWTCVGHKALSLYYVESTNDNVWADTAYLYGVQYPILHSDNEVACWRGDTEIT